MTKIGILSDTHGSLPSAATTFFNDVNEIWHAGDIGNTEVINNIREINPRIKAVFGNIDGMSIKTIFPEQQIFSVENKKVCLLHIAGKPGNYTTLAKELIRVHHPDILVCGHSHILKIMYDESNSLLFINPGAAGRFGLHKHITMVKLTISNNEFKDIEIYDRKKSL
ncbi:MAG: metallophosphoesterase family protein [Bacteroidales bacterium]|nr:metallophosphoesterase family protein [Bacteroidales bacterium]